MHAALNRGFRRCGTEGAPTSSFLEAPHLEFEWTGSFSRLKASQYLPASKSIDLRGHSSPRVNFSPLKNNLTLTSPFPGATALEFAAASSRSAARPRWRFGSFLRGFQPSTNSVFPTRPVGSRSSHEASYSLPGLLDLVSRQRWLRLSIKSTKIGPVTF